MSNLKTQTVMEIAAGFGALALMDEVVVKDPCFVDTVPEDE